MGNYYNGDNYMIIGKKITLSVAAVALTTSVAMAQTSAYSFGNSTYYSDGSSAYKAGNSAYSSDGTSAYKAGNSTYYSDGTSAYKSGNSTYYSD